MIMKSCLDFKSEDHIIRTSFGNARAFPNFCCYICKCSFLAVISKPAGPMDSRAIPKVILHWYRPKVISETIKRWGGVGWGY